VKVREGSSQETLGGPMSSGKRWYGNPAEANDPLTPSTHLSHESAEFQNETALPNLAEANSDKCPQTAYSGDNRGDSTIFNLLRAIEGTDMATHLVDPVLVEVKQSIDRVNELLQSDPAALALPELRPLPAEVRSTVSQPVEERTQEIHQHSYTEVSLPQFVPIVPEITKDIPLPQFIPIVPESTEDNAAQSIKPQDAESVPGTPFVGLKKAIDRIGPQVRTATGALLDRAEKELSTWVGTVLSPHKRRSTRFVKPPLAVYYWTGDQPEPREIANISSSGLYLLTDERWYPGTRVSMTLQRTDLDNKARKEWISVDVRIVRYGADGVGGAFLFSDSGTQGFANSDNCADKKTLERFIKRLTVDATA
jgi:hypothetical protein